MKKIICMFLVFTLIFCSFSQVFADIDKENDNKEKEYTYDYNGIEIVSNEKLTEQEINSLMETILSKDPGDIQPSFIPEPEPGAILVDGPEYNVNDNTDVREVSNLIVAWVSTKIPGPLSKSTLFNWVFSKLTGWTDEIEDTYSGSWVSKSWSTYYQGYKYYTTLVHYSDDTFSEPISVQYYMTAVLPD